MHRQSSLGGWYTRFHVWAGHLENKMILSKVGWGKHIAQLDWLVSQALKYALVTSGHSHSHQYLPTYQQLSNYLSNYRSCANLPTTAWGANHFAATKHPGGFLGTGRQPKAEMELHCSQHFFRSAGSNKTQRDAAVGSSPPT